MIIVLTEETASLELSEPVAQVYYVADFALQGNVIPLSLGTDEGQLLVCLSPNVWGVIDPPSANNQTIVSDLTLPGLWKIGTLAGGGGGVVELTNKDGSDSTTGSVVVLDTTNDSAFKGTTIPFALGVIGVTAEDIANNATGDVTIAGKNDVQVAGNVQRGEWMIAASTKWRAKTAGYDKPMNGGVVGYAITSYSGGGNGTVTGVIMPEPRHLTTAGTAWALGGYNTVEITNAQKFTIASATWAGVSGAALPSAVSEPHGFGYGTTAGYTVGGGTTPVVTAYKTSFATETTAIQSSANLPAARRVNAIGGMNGSAHGYQSGGYNSIYQSSTTKLTYGTDTMSSALGTSLSVARASHSEFSNGVTGYAQAGNNGANTGVSDKVTFSTDTWSDNNSGDVSAAIYGGGISFPSDCGYMAMKSGGTAYSKKIAFATDISANVTSTLSADQLEGVGVTDGSGLGWQSGHTSSPYSVSHKFTKATETYASDSGAVMATGKFRAAQFNNGAY